MIECCERGKIGREGGREGETYLGGRWRKRQRRGEEEEVLLL